MTSATRCPVCDGRLRPDDAWCGQCLADLRPPPLPAPPPPAQRARPAMSPAAERRADEPSGADRHGEDAVDPAAMERLADEWVARLATTERGAGLPALAGVTRARGARAGLAAGAAVAVLGLVLLLMVAGGAVL